MLFLVHVVCALTGRLICPLPFAKRSLEMVGIIPITSVGPSCHFPLGELLAVSSSPHVGTHFANIHVHGRCRFIVYASISSLFAKCHCASSLCGASDGQRCWSCSHSRDNRASWAGGSCLGEPSNHLGR